MSEKVAHGIKRRPTKRKSALDCEMFLLVTQTQLIPALRPGDIITLDRLQAHKPASLHETIEAAGTVLSYLSPCSSDFSPIEMAFSKLQSWLLIPMLALGDSF